MAESKVSADVRIFRQCNTATGQRPSAGLADADFSSTVARDPLKSVARRSSNAIRLRFFRSRSHKTNEPMDDQSFTV